MYNMKFFVLVGSLALLLCQLATGFMIAPSSFAGAHLVSLHVERGLQGLHATPCKHYLQLSCTLWPLFVGSMLYLWLIL